MWIIPRNLSRESRAIVPRKSFCLKANLDFQAMYEKNIYPSTLGILVFCLFTVFLQQTCIAQKQHACAPSSCGKITNISYPFLLKHDPQNCSNPRFELACENSITVLDLELGRYYVESINYNNNTMRLVDPIVQQTGCFSIPNTFFVYSNFNTEIGEGLLSFGSLIQPIIYLNCSNRVSDRPEYVDMASCMGWNSNGHIYAVAKYLSAQRLKVECRVISVAATSLWGPDDYTPTNIESLSYTDIHRALVFGYEIRWFDRSCADYCGTHNCGYDGTTGKYECYDKIGILEIIARFFTDYHNGVHKGLFRIVGKDDPNSDYTTMTGILRAVRNYVRRGDDVFRVLALLLGSITGRYLLPYLATRFLFGLIILFFILIYTWRRRHFSIYGNIEDFLQRNNLMPIRYSYKEIKNMTRGFRDKLGAGSFGSVFKGKLRSGPFVAVKKLGNDKSNGQDFISEVATIGRIHHVNVVRLVGFCFEGSKRALVYEFMPNGSLDKYILSEERSVLLSYEKMLEISLGVARGIAYLHQGCDMRILHFDIKPHNILLDGNFIPKVSDFGLAKLYPINDSIIDLTAARGTIGYIAPELFYMNLGGVSFKADVYSFGMLLMEMTSRRKNLNPHAEHSSQLYFPLWIYDQFNEEKDIEMENITEEEKKVAKKMFIVALWCIQLKPCDRPSMSRVVEMLEGEIESLAMPPKPTLYPHETIAEDVEMNSGLESTSDLTDSKTNRGENASDPLLENSF